MDVLDLPVSFLTAGRQPTKQRICVLVNSISMLWQGALGDRVHGLAQYRAVQHDKNLGPDDARPPARSEPVRSRLSALFGVSRAAAGLSGS